MRSTVVSALLGLALIGCSSCTSSSAASSTSDAATSAPPQAPPSVHQVSPVRPPMVAALRVELESHAPGASCDQLLVNGQNSDLKTLGDAARADVAHDPGTKADVIVYPPCAASDAQQVKDALAAAGVKNVETPPVPAAATLPGAPPTEAEKLAAQGTTAFAANLYGQLIKSEKGNLFFSPTSVAAALALVDVGAAGQTASQLDQLLHTGLPHEQSTQAVAALLQRYQASRGDATLDIANRVWGAQKFEFKPSYLATVQQQFGAAAERVDFSSGDTARGMINAWVKEQTRGKIPELIGRNVLGPQTQFVLTNAVYFYGNWQSPFDAKNTAPAPFTLASGQQVQAPMMHQVVKAHGVDTGEVQVVELPYGKDGTLAFDLILPKQANGLAALESKLSGEWLARTLGMLPPARVTLAMPRFTERSQFELAQPLAALGAGSLFGQPDLSGMTDARGISISAVVHQAFVDVNEKGTEAAAATAVIGTRMLQRLNELQVTADHPFLFVIRDTATGGILFMGRVADPR